MGRGRAKAKQTKVARELKYHTLETDFAALQRELGSDDHVDGHSARDADDVDDDPYSPPADAYSPQADADGHARR